MIQRIKQRKHDQWSLLRKFNHKHETYTQQQPQAKSEPPEKLQFERFTVITLGAGWSASTATMLSRRIFEPWQPYMKTNYFNKSVVNRNEKQRTSLPATPPAARTSSELASAVRAAEPIRFKWSELAMHPNHFASILNISCHRSIIYEIPNQVRRMTITQDSKVKEYY